MHVLRFYIVRTDPGTQLRIPMHCNVTFCRIVCLTLGATALTAPDKTAHTVPHSLPTPLFSFPPFISRPHFHGNSSGKGGGGGAWMMTSTECCIQVVPSPNQAVSPSAGKLHPTLLSPPIKHGLADIFIHAQVTQRETKTHKNITGYDSFL